MGLQMSKFLKFVNYRVMALDLCSKFVLLNIFCTNVWILIKI